MYSLVYDRKLTLDPSSVGHIILACTTVIVPVLLACLKRPSNSLSAMHLIWALRPQIASFVLFASFDLMYVRGVYCCLYGHDYR